MMNIISLGAGVQSSTMALMAAHGEITPMPDAAIFADTQSEPKAVYTWLDWLEQQLPFPVYRVTAGNLLDNSVKLRTSQKTGNVYMKALIPAFNVRTDGSVGLMGRRCTADYKVGPIMREVKRLLGIKRASKDMVAMADQWIGISTDEASRMKPSQYPFVKSRWPLIEQNMSRNDCLIWMSRHGYSSPPKSACVFCPFHSDAMWADLKTNHADDFAYAVDAEKRIQASSSCQTGTARTQGVPYLHRSGKPISEVIFRSAPSHQQLDLFLNECEGMCGV